MPTKIFVGNLSEDTESYDIRILFEKYGTVTECDVLKNYGFVHMSVESEARSAISELDGSTVKGNHIRVESSTGSSGRGGGRGRGGGFGDRGRGRGRGGGDRGRGRGRGGDRYSDRPPPPPEYDPYYRRPAPYDYYDRPYSAERRGDDRRLPPPPEDRYMRDRYHPYDRRPPPPDPYDRPYERPRAPPSDPYRRPPPDYYSRPRYPHDEPYYPEARYPYDDPYYREARYPHEEHAEAAPPPPPRGGDYYNGYPADYENGHESSAKSAQSYYDRFYKTPPARSGYPKPAAKPGQKDDDQSFLQTEPIFF